MIVLSDHPRWMFRKNSIEFPVRFDYYLYKCLLVCAHTSHNHKILTKNYIVLHKCSHTIYLNLIVFLDVSH